MNEENGSSFELGLVMAGAVSAGAYTAGVVDFLLEAFEEWEKAKATGGIEVPRHRVVLRAVAGASAGGMTGAILAGLYGRERIPVTGQAKELNPLYEAWVNRIDIHDLLSASDSPTRALESALNCDTLERIAADVFNPNTAPVQRPYLARDMALYLAVTNLRGVPY